MVARKRITRYRARFLPIVAGNSYSVRLWHIFAENNGRTARRAHLIGKDLGRLLDIQAARLAWHGGTLKAGTLAMVEGPTGFPMVVTDDNPHPYYAPGDPRRAIPMAERKSPLGPDVYHG